MKQTIPFFNSFTIDPNNSIKFRFTLDLKEEVKVSRILLDKLKNPGVTWQAGVLSFTEAARSASLVEQFLSLYKVSNDILFNEFKENIAQAKTPLSPSLNFLLNSLLKKITALTPSFEVEIKETPRRPTVFASRPTSLDIHSAVLHGQAATIPVLPTTASPLLQKEVAPTITDIAISTIPETPKSKVAEIKKNIVQIEFPLYCYIRSTEKDSKQEEIVFVFNNDENLNLLVGLILKKYPKSMLLNPSGLEIVRHQKNELIFDLIQDIHFMIHEFIRLYKFVTPDNFPPFIGDINDYILKRTNSLTNSHPMLFTNFMFIIKVNQPQPIQIESTEPQLPKTSAKPIELFPTAADFKDSAVKLTFANPGLALMAYYELNKSLKKQDVPSECASHIPPKRTVKCNELHIMPKGCQEGFFTTFLQLFSSKNHSVTEAAAELAKHAASSGGLSIFGSGSESRAANCAKAFEIMLKHRSDIQIYSPDKPDPSLLGKTPVVSDKTSVLSPKFG